MKITKWFCLLLVMALITAAAAGCSKGSKGKDAASPGAQADGLKSEGAGGKGKGRFLENEIALPDRAGRILAFGKLQDGTLAAVAEDKGGKSYYVLKSSDQGKGWKEVPVQGIKGRRISYAAVSPDGDAALIHYAKGCRADISIVGAKGRAETVTLRLPDKIEENQVRQAAYDKKGNLFAMDMQGVVLKADWKEGTFKEAFDTEGLQINYFGIAGDVLLAVHDKGIRLFDTEKGNTLDSEALLDDLIKEDKGLASNDMDFGAPMLFAEGTDSGSIVLVNKNGIFHYNRSGSVIEQLADASLLSLGGGNIVFQNLAVLDKDNIFIVVNDSGEFKLFQYSYDSKAASAPDKEITVYALDESSLLRKAVTLFQKEHPDIYVKLEFGLTGDDSVTLEDALSVLSTNILAGKGPDVLILDGMPAESYIEKGILADISDVIDEVDQKEGVLPGIKEGSRKDGKIYAFPARFLLSVIEGDKDTVKSGESLEGMAKRITQLKKGSKGGVIPQDKGTMTLLRDLYYADSASWMTEGNSIDEKALTDYLSCAKQIYDVDANSKEQDYLNKTGDGTVDGIKAGTLNETDLIEGSSKMAFGTLPDFWSLQNMISSWQLTNADYGLLNREVHSYIPYLSAGVTESGNKETAKEFVKLLLGKKTGDSITNGFPVNKTAFRLQCEEAVDSRLVKDDSSIMFSNEDGKDFSFNTVNLTKGQVGQFTAFAESLKKPAMDNRSILNIVLEQGDKYLLGEQNLGDTVDAILKKVNLYLAENS